MAKRAPKDEKPFNPIESALVERVASRIPFPETHPSGIPEFTGMATLLEDPAIAPPAPKRPPREKRVLLSWEEELALQRLLDQLSETLETPVKLSNALRSCLILLRHAQSQIVTQASRQGTLVRPANNDQTGIAMFEQRLAAIFQAGFAATSKIE
ncbi:MAG TPA: hypothetical protein VHW24_18365 [Bryobacteraceae bacterium]|jgi:hypothetical protein|nr:hypothetical protein [Bryobacteraceae bacterium]